MSLNVDIARSVAPGWRQKPRGSAAARTWSGTIEYMVKMGGVWPFRGRVVWLTPEQGGRASRPPVPSVQRDYAHTAFVPPHTAGAGLASFALRDFESGAWTSAAEGHWLVVENDGAQRVAPGTVVACTEGARVVAYFHVEHVVGEPVDDRD